MENVTFMKISRLIIFFSVSLLISCYPRMKYNSCTLPATPVNLGDINSIYDDYNSDIPTVGDNWPLCFSSNRGSKGKDFDIIYIDLAVMFDRSTGELFVGKEPEYGWNPNPASANINKAVLTIRSNYDELGPYLIPQGDGYRLSGKTDMPYQSYLLLYGSNDTGNLDIKITDNMTGFGYSQPRRIKFLNSDKDDAYPTLNSDTSKIFFCSDREGDFDIYMADVNKKTNLLNAFNDTTPRVIVKNTVLSSDMDDKCPYIQGNRMVFTSNRSGGYGGFDLYYSVYSDGSWSEPVNFGPEINSEYDEYRPVHKVLSKYYFTNDFMIFSSNRPGGLGGFDLYYVGIDNLTN